MTEEELKRRAIRIGELAIDGLDFLSVVEQWEDLEEEEADEVYRLTRSLKVVFN